MAVLVTEMVVALFIATAGSLALLAGHGINFNFLSFLNQLPQWASITMIACAGAWLITDILAVSVKNLKQDVDEEASSSSSISSSSNSTDLGKPQPTPPAKLPSALDALLAQRRAQKAASKPTPLSPERALPKPVAHGRVRERSNHGRIDGLFDDVRINAKTLAMLRNGEDPTAEGKSQAQRNMSALRVSQKSKTDDLVRSNPKIKVIEAPPPPPPPPSGALKPRAERPKSMILPQPAGGGRPGVSVNLLQEQMNLLKKGSSNPPKLPSALEMDTYIAVNKGAILGWIAIVRNYFEVKRGEETIQRTSKSLMESAKAKLDVESVELKDAWIEDFAKQLKFFVFSAQNDDEARTRIDTVLVGLLKLEEKCSQIGPALAAPTMPSDRNPEKEKAKKLQEQQDICTQARIFKPYTEEAGFDVTTFNPRPLQPMKRTLLFTNDHVRVEDLEDEVVKLNTLINEVPSGELCDPKKLKAIQFQSDKIQELVRRLHGSKQVPQELFTALFPRAAEKA